MGRDDRAVNTVIDVTLALVLIAASMLMLVTFLGSGEPQTEPVRADQTAETFAGTTTTVDYSVEGITEYESEYHEDIFNGTEGSHYFQRSAHGTTTGLLADAAVTNVEFWNERWTRAGTDFERSISSSALGVVTRLDHSARVEAIWRPYEGAGIVGEASAGEAVPPDANVNSVTFAAPSGIENVSEELRRNYQPDGEFKDAGEVIARAIFDELLPPEQMQRDLESSSARRDLALYRYNRMSRVMNETHEGWSDDRLVDEDWEYGYNFTPDEELSRERANTLRLNEYMIQQTLANRIADELDRQFEGVPTVAELNAAVSPEDVQLTVRTWETND